MKTLLSSVLLASLRRPEQQVAEPEVLVVDSSAGVRIRSMKPLSWSRSSKAASIISCELVLAADEVVLELVELLLGEVSPRARPPRELAR